MPHTRPHPAKAIIVAQGRTIVDVGAAIGVNAHTLGRVLNRHSAPWPALGRRLADELGVGEADLFSDEFRSVA